MHVDQARRRLLEAGRPEDLRADVAVQADERERVELADAGDDGGRLGQREPELLVLVGRGEEVVGLGVHAAVDPHEHRLHDAATVRDRRKALELDPAVEHDRADADLHGAVEFGDRLVVAVESQARGFCTGGERDGQLPAAADVDRQALFGDPAHHLGREEGLAGVVHPGLHAPGRGGRAERGERAPGVRAHLVLVEHVERSAERVAQPIGAHPRDAQHAVIVALGGGGPDRRHEVVRVGGDAEPVGNRRSGGRGHGVDQSVSS